MERPGMTTMEAIQNLKEVDDIEENKLSISESLLQYIENVVFSPDYYNVTNTGQSIGPIPLLLVTSLREPSKFRVFLLVIEYNGDEALFGEKVFREFKEEMVSMANELKAPVAILSATLKRDSSTIPSELRTDMLMNEGCYYDSELTFI